MKDNFDTIQVGDNQQGSLNEINIPSSDGYDGIGMPKDSNDTKVNFDT
jgi:hypothetical protein